MTAPPPLAIPGYVWDGKRFYKQTKQQKLEQEINDAKRRRVDQLAASSQPRTSTAPRPRSRRKLEPGWETLKDAHSLDITRRASIATHEHALRSLCVSKYRSMRVVYPDCFPVDEEVVRLAFDDVNPFVLRCGGSHGSVATGNLARPRDDSTYFPNDEFGWRMNHVFPSRVTSLESQSETILATCLGEPAEVILAKADPDSSWEAVKLRPQNCLLWSAALAPSPSTGFFLGTDDAVLYPTISDYLTADDAAREGPPEVGKIESIVTGGNRGEGTVFSMDVYEDLLFLGMRKGQVVIKDLRSLPGFKDPSRKTKTDWYRRECRFRFDKRGFGPKINVGSPVTNIKVLKENPFLVVVAAMNGSLGVYDLRYLREGSPPNPAAAETRAARSRDGERRAEHAEHIGTGRGAGRGRGREGSRRSEQPRLNEYDLHVPVLRLEGHVNTHSSDLGFDVWRDEFIVAAGEDARLRLWSLRTRSSSGEPIFPRSTIVSSASGAARSPDPPCSVQNPDSSAPEEPSPWLRTFRSPIKSVKLHDCLDPLDLTTRRGLAPEDGGNPTSSGTARVQETRHEPDSQAESTVRWGLPSLWVADGPGIEVFSL
ncbi:hypothetical protein JCM10212_000375 [Sporobolomyces blumeae]